MKRLSKKSKSPASVSPDMNVTPLVDVVLVLLIIFMVMAPLTTSAFGVRLPPKIDQKDRQLQQVNKPTENLVLKVGQEGQVTINSVEVERGELAKRLNLMLKSRPNNVLYMDAANEAPYGEMLITMEECRKGGADPIVLMTREI